MTTTNSEDREFPPLLHMYVSRRSVYGGKIVLKQPTEDILIVQRSDWSRGLAVTLAVVIGGLPLLLASVPLLIWGCMCYAGRQRYSKWIGLLGVTGIPGLS